MSSCVSVHPTFKVNYRRCFVTSLKTISIFLFLATTEYVYPWYIIFGNLGTTIIGGRQFGITLEARNRIHIWELDQFPSLFSVPLPMTPLLP